MNKEIENYNKEEWGGWKIVSKMLDNPDESGIYPTGKCYQKLYEFVCKQKDKAKKEQCKEIIEKQYELLISCLPEDAENLSTITLNQAQRLIKCFIKKNPWN